MLGWLRRIAPPVPSVQSGESENQTPSTERRVERLLDRLGSDGKTVGESVGEALHKISLPPRLDTQPVQESAAQTLNESQLLPGSDRGTQYVAGVDPDHYHDALPFLVKAIIEVGGKPEDDVNTTAAKIVSALRNGYGFTPDRIAATQPYLLQFVKDFRNASVRFGAEEEEAVRQLLVSAEQPAAEVLNAGDPLPTASSEAAGEPAEERLNASNPLPMADSETRPQLFPWYRDSARDPLPTAEELAGESLKTGDPLPRTDSEAAEQPAAESLKAEDPPPTTDSEAAEQPPAESLKERDPLPRTDNETAEQPAGESLKTRDPLPRIDGEVADQPASEALNAIDLPPKPAAGTAGSRPGGMFVIAVCSQKGGAGKTTIAAHLAVRAGAAGNGPAVLIDTDPQGSLGEWWRARHDAQPALAKVKLEDLAANLAELRSYGTAVAIIDTPPALTASIEQVIAVADLIVIPARPSPHDLRAVGATVEMARRVGKPFLFVVNGAAPRASITAQAVAALSEHGRVVPVILYQRTDFAASMIDGRTVMETAPSSRSAQEIAELWRYVYEQIEMRVAAA